MGCGASSRVAPLPSSPTEITQKQNFVGPSSEDVDSSSVSVKSQAKVRKTQLKTKKKPYHHKNASKKHGRLQNCLDGHLRITNLIKNDILDRSKTNSSFHVWCEVFQFQCCSNPKSIAPSFADLAKVIIAMDKSLGIIEESFVATGYHDFGSEMQKIMDAEIDFDTVVASEEEALRNFRKAKSDFDTATMKAKGAPAAKEKLRNLEIQSEIAERRHKELLNLRQEKHKKLLEFKKAQSGILTSKLLEAHKYFQRCEEQFQTENFSLPPDAPFTAYETAILQNIDVKKKVLKKTLREQNFLMVRRILLAQDKDEEYIELLLWPEEDSDDTIFNNVLTMEEFGRHLCEAEFEFLNAWKVQLAALEQAVKDFETVEAIKATLDAANKKLDKAMNELNKARKKGHEFPRDKLVQLESIAAVCDSACQGLLKQLEEKVKQTYDNLEKNMKSSVQAQSEAYRVYFEKGQSAVRQYSENPLQMKKEDQEKLLLQIEKEQEELAKKTEEQEAELNKQEQQIDAPGVVDKVEEPKSEEVVVATAAPIETPEEAPPVAVLATPEHLQASKPQEEQPVDLKSDEMELERLRQEEMMRIEEQRQLEELEQLKQIEQKILKEKEEQERMLRERRDFEEQAKREQAAKEEEARREKERMFELKEKEITEKHREMLEKEREIQEKERSLLEKEKEKEREIQEKERHLQEKELEKERMLQEKEREVLEKQKELLEKGTKKKEANDSDADDSDTDKDTKKLKTKKKKKKHKKTNLPISSESEDEEEVEKPKRRKDKLEQEYIQKLEKELKEIKDYKERLEREYKEKQEQDQKAKLEREYKERMERELDKLLKEKELLLETGLREKKTYDSEWKERLLEKERAEREKLERDLRTLQEKDLRDKLEREFKEKMEKEYLIKSKESEKVTTKSVDLEEEKEKLRKERERMEKEYKDKLEHEFQRQLQEKDAAMHKRLDELHAIIQEKIVLEQQTQMELERLKKEKEEAKSSQVPQLPQITQPQEPKAKKAPKKSKAESESEDDEVEEEEEKPKKPSKKKKNTLRKKAQESEDDDSEREHSEGEPVSARRKKKAEKSPRNAKSPRDRSPRDRSPRDKSPRDRKSPREKKDSKESHNEKEGSQKELAKNKEEDKPQPSKEMDKPSPKESKQKEEIHTEKEKQKNIIDIEVQPAPQHKPEQKDLIRNSSETKLTTVPAVASPSSPKANSPKEANHHEHSVDPASPRNASVVMTTDLGTAMVEDDKVEAETSEESGHKKPTPRSPRTGFEIKPTQKEAMPKYGRSLAPVQGLSTTNQIALKLQLEQQALRNKILQHELESNKQLLNCVSCFTHLREYMVQPCNHLCVCKSCAESLANCPICGEKKTGTVAVSVAPPKEAQAP